MIRLIHPRTLVGLFLVGSVTGCGTLLRTAAWPIKQTVSFGADITAHTAKTAVSLAAETAKFTFVTGLDATVGAAARTVIRPSTETLVRAAAEEAVGAKGRGIAAVIEVLTRTAAGTPDHSR